MKKDPLRTQRGEEKFKRIPIKIEPTTPATRTSLPSWIRTRASLDSSVQDIKTLLRENHLSSVCEEAACPNLSECFSKGTATFMIMGNICTRRCTFCDVAFGKPNPLDPKEPQHLATALEQMRLKYVVITSVDRDDLRDGGASHFVSCIQACRIACPDTKIEILVPDFRGRQEVALELLGQALPDVFNHNLETIPRLYKQIQPGSDYQASLNMLKIFKARYPLIPTKSGIMLGFGETLDEIIEVMQDLRAQDCDMLTLGQYLQPSCFHQPVTRYVPPEEFHKLRETGLKMGFKNVASGPLVRSSYHADEQAQGKAIC